MHWIHVGYMCYDVFSWHQDSCIIWRRRTATRAWSITTSEDHLLILKSMYRSMPCSLQFQTNSQPVRTWLHGKLPCMRQHILYSYFMFCWWKLIEISRVLHAFNVNMIEKIRHRSDSETLGPRALIVLQVPLMHADGIDSLRSLWISCGVLFEPGVMQNEWPVLLSPLGQDYLHISILNNTYLIFGGWLVHFTFMSI